MRSLIILAIVLFLVLIGMILRDELSHPGRSLVIFYTSNLRGQIRPFTADIGPLSGLEVGGFAFIKGVIDDTIRRQRLRRDHCLLVDTGDALFGSPEANLTGGEAPARLMRLMGYDAIAVGNLDFEFGLETMRRMARQDVPLLAANYRDPAGGSSPAMLPYRILNVAGGRIGLIGLGMNDLAHNARKENIEGLQVVDRNEALRDTLAELDRQAVSPKILVSHEPDPFGTHRRDGPISTSPGADLLRRVDVIVADGNSGLSDEWPQRPLLCPTAPARGAAVGMVRIPWVGGRWAFDQAHKTMLPVQSRMVLGDPRLVTEIAAVESKVDTLLEAKVAEAAADFKRQFNSESTMGGLVAASMKSVSKSQVALLNSGTMKSSFLAGPITVRDLFNCLPFENRIVQIIMPGWALEGLIESSLIGERSFLQAAGLACTFSSRGPPGFRIIQVLIDDEPLAWDRDYTVAVTDFMLENLDAWPELGLGSRHRVLDLQRESLQRYFQDHPTVHPATQPVFIDILDDRTLLTQALNVDVITLDRPLTNVSTTESMYLRYLADILRVEANADFALVQPRLLHYRTPLTPGGPELQRDGSPADPPTSPEGMVGDGAPNSLPEPTPAAEGSASGAVTTPDDGSPAGSATPSAAVVGGSAETVPDGLPVSIDEQFGVHGIDLTPAGGMATGSLTDTTMASDWDGPLQTVTPIRVVSDIPERTSVEILHLSGSEFEKLVRSNLRQGEGMLCFAGFSLEVADDGRLLKLFPWEGDLQPDKVYKVVVPGNFPVEEGAGQGWKRFRVGTFASDLRRVFIKGMRTRQGRVELRRATY